MHYDATAPSSASMHAGVRCLKKRVQPFCEEAADACNQYAAQNNNVNWYDSATGLGNFHYGTHRLRVESNGTKNNAVN